MNGVLERMAKRALGALPTVQPLTTPHYSPPVKEMPGASVEPGTTLDFETPPRDIEEAPRSRPWRDTDAAQEKAEKLPTDEFPIASQTPLHPVSRLASCVAWEAIDPLERKSRTGRIQPLEVLAPKESERRKEGPWRTIPSPLPRLERTAGGEFSLAADGARIDRPILERATEGRSPQSEVTEKSTRPDESGYVIAAIPASERQIAKSAPRRESVTPATQALAPTEEKTEIHISIGSIELRAPRVEARPQPAPFRPRVTLDEFLRRKPESHA